VVILNEGDAMQTLNDDLKPGLLIPAGVFTVFLLLMMIGLSGVLKLYAQDEKGAAVEVATPPTPTVSQPAKAEAVPAEEPKPQPSEDEAEILSVQKEIQSYVRAFNEKNAEVLAGHWSLNGVYDAPSGEQHKGREAILALFKGYFEKQEQPVKLEVMTESIEILSANIARETGWATVTKGEEEPLESSYMAYYTKEEGRWKLDSVQESDVIDRSPHYEALSELEWLIGDWIDSDGSATILTFNDWTMNQNFITSNFSVNFEGFNELNGVQLIGWDPVAEVIRSWIFDSNGGYGTGTWTRDGDKWSVHTLYITANGEKGSSINIYRYIDENSFSYESVGRERDGNILPSIPEVVVQRR